MSRLSKTIIAPQLNPDTLEVGKTYYMFNGDPVKFIAWSPKECKPEDALIFQHKDSVITRHKNGQFKGNWAGHELVVVDDLDAKTIYINVYRGGKIETFYCKDDALKFANVKGWGEAFILAQEFMIIGNKLV